MTTLYGEITTARDYPLPTGTSRLRYREALYRENGTRERGKVVKVKAGR